MMALTNKLYELKAKLDHNFHYELDKLIIMAESLEEFKQAVLLQNGMIQVSSRDYGILKSFIESQYLRRTSNEEWADKVESENRWLRRIIVEFEKMTNQRIEIVNGEPKIKLLTEMEGK